MTAWFVDMFVAVCGYAKRKSTSLFYAYTFSDWTPELNSLGIRRLNQSHEQVWAPSAHCAWSATLCLSWCRPGSSRRWLEYERSQGSWGTRAARAHTHTHTHTHLAHIRTHLHAHMCCVVTCIHVSVLCVCLRERECVCLVVVCNINSNINKGSEVCVMWGMM